MCIRDSGYRAPEVYDRDYGKAADWWNVGILIIEMLTAENPLRGENRRESEYLTKHKELALPAYVKESAKKISLAFLNLDPTKRLGCVEAEGGVAQIKAHEFFTSLECDAPKIKGLDWEKLMAMEHPVRRRARHPETPIMYYANGGSAYLHLQSDLQCDMISLDWAADMEHARATLGADRLVQGNVDPTVLFGTDEQIRTAVHDCIRKAGGKGHILNLGHGVLQGTPERAVQAFVDAAKEVEL